MRYILFLIFFLCEVANVVAQNAPKDYQDSLRQLLGEHESPDTTRLSLLISLAEAFKNEDPKLSFEYIEEGLEIADSKSLAYQKAVLHRALVQHYSVQGNNEDAIINGLIAANIFDSLNRKSDLLITQSQLIPTYRVAGYGKKALELSLNNLELVKGDPVTASKARFYFDVGNSYRDLENYEKAVDYYAGALSISEQVGFKPGIAVITINLAFIKMQLEAYSEAKSLLKDQLEYFREKNNINLISTSLEYLGDIAVAEGKHDQAIRYFEEVMVYLKELGFRARIQDVSMKLYIQYSITGQVKLAKENEQQYKFLRDSLEEENVAQVIGELQTKYETEKKEAEIASLNQQSAIQELQIKQKNQTIYFSIIAFLLILAVVYFIYYQQIAARKRKQTELEQRFLLSQLNPHFISNALVAVQSSLMDKDTESASAYLHTFSRLMREIMENSREEFIPVEDEVTMLEDYLEINQKRLDNAFRYSVIVDENIDQQLDAIPPMFVQPFVENAIEHGLSADSKEGEINVEFTKEGDFVKISVLDNGKGLSVQSEGVSSKKSLSSSIIKERMELFNQSLKNKIELLVDNRVDKEGKIMGTVVELRVPIQQ